MTARRPSLSTRLVAAALVWLALLLGLGGGVLAWAFRDSVERQFALRLDAIVRGALASLSVGADGGLTLTRPLGEPRFDQVYSGWYWQLTAPGGRQIRSRSLWDQSLAAEGGHDGAAFRHAAGPNGESLLVAERDIQVPELGGQVHVLVAADRAEVAAGVRRFNLLLTVALGALGAGVAGAVVFQVRFGLRPLRDLAVDLEAVRRGERPRLAGDYPREVAPLAQAMNRVLDDDAELIERARTHVGNLAHGLKTPLAVLQAELGVDPDPRVVSEQIATMRRLVAHHLGRAAAGAGTGRAATVRVAVAPVAAGIAAALEKINAERALVLEQDIGADVRFKGDAEDLAEMLGNLMENACKWARGRVRVRAGYDRTTTGATAGGTTGAALVVTVEDDGPGLSPEQAAMAAERGKRLDEMTEGWGLGLSIVADLVAVNGGTMSFGRSALGGLEVRLRLPGGE